MRYLMKQFLNQVIEILGEDMKSGTGKQAAFTQLTKKGVFTVGDLAGFRYLSVD